MYHNYYNHSNHHTNNNNNEEEEGGEYDDDNNDFEFYNQPTDVNNNNNNNNNMEETYNTTELFQTYELEYNELSIAIKNHLFQLNDLLMNQQQHQQVDVGVGVLPLDQLQRKVKRQLDNLDGIISNMETEISTSRNHHTMNVRLRERLDNCRGDARRMRLEFQKVVQRILFADDHHHSNHYHSHHHYSYSSSDSEDDDDDDDLEYTASKSKKKKKQRFNKNENYNENNNPIMKAYESRRLLNESSNTLQETLRMASQIEESGISILGNLVDQRGVIERARDRLRETDMEIVQSSRILGRMEWRAFMQKCILVTAIIVLVMAIVLYIIYSIRRLFTKK